MASENENMNSGEYNGKDRVQCVQPVQRDWPPSFLRRSNATTPAVKPAPEAAPCAPCDDQSAAVEQAPLPTFATATPSAETVDHWQLIDDDAKQHLLGDRRFPQPCIWCGGRYRHNPACVVLHPDWQAEMPFGRYRGRPLAEVPRDYLLWLVGRLDPEDTLLNDVRGALGAMGPSGV